MGCGPTLVSPHCARMQCMHHHRSAPPASVSRRCSLPSTSAPCRGMQRRQLSRAGHPVPTRRLQQHRCHAAAEEEGEGELHEEHEEGETREQALARWNQVWNLDQYMGDNTFKINTITNMEPDVMDPDWASKVTDWHEFWNHQKWDEEIDGVDDEIDAGGHPLTSRERILTLIRSIKDNRLRADVQQWIPTSETRIHYSTWENPPVDPERTPPNPAYTHCDLRAISEKQAWKARMDAEWHRRKALVGRLAYPDPYKDIRLEHFGRQVSDIGTWSERRVYNLITLNGTAARPEDHGAFVENPLVPIDYVQTMGVHHVEETEDFLRAIGHLATPQDEERFDQEEVMLQLDELGLLFDEEGDEGEVQAGGG